MKKVLIIDDEEDICMLLKGQLSKKSFTVHCETNLKGGLRAVSLFQPSFILLDNNLPDGMGIDKIPEIRLLCPKARILVISAFTSMAHAAIQNGADEFIAKPFHLSFILEKLK